MGLTLRGTAARPLGSMGSMRHRLGFLLLCVLGASCDGPAPPPDAATGTDAGPPLPPPPDAFADVALDGHYRIPGMSAPAHVVRTDRFVPHVYAANRLDAYRVLGFVLGRDRYFQLDIVSRLSQGLVSQRLGDVGLASDIENRMTGADLLTQIYVDALSAEEAADVDAFAEGINAYVAAVRARQLPAPKEYELAFGLLGARNAGEVMRDWTRRDVMALAATMTFQTGFETRGPGLARALARIDDHFPGAVNRDLRMAGLRDIADRWAPPRPSASANGWGIDTAGRTSAPFVAPRRGARAVGPLRVEAGALDRAVRRLERLDARWHPADLEGWGSNVWAVMGAATRDGRALLAGDGHLQLSIPSLMWEYGLDTELLGDADPITVVGVTLIGAPGIATGTNGRVAWGGTNFVTDVTDWYAEELLLDAEGAPRASRFGGEERPLTRIDETYEIADVPALDSPGRTLVLPRWVTFDGRMITSIEGRAASEDEVLGPGETLVNLMGDWVVPGDEDGDGRVTALSFYYAPFDGGSLLRAVAGFERADDVEEWRQAMRHVIGFGLNFAAADRDGGVAYTGYHAMPCRTYLPRDPATGRFEPDADPSLIIDGTRYGAWSIPLDAQGRVDEAAAAAGGPTACAVPFDEWPQAVNPARQYVHNANNDPGAITTVDGDPWNDPYYIGGPWDLGYRASRIAARLEAAIAAGTASIAEMQSIQGDHHSNVGEDFAPVLIEAIGAARDAAAGSPAPGTPEARLAASYAARGARLDEVEDRIADWRDDGYPTPSGVDTFYDTSTEDTRRQSVATMIFAAWMSRYLAGVWDDEGIDGGVSPGQDWRLRSLDLLVRGRGAANPLALPSHDPATGESVFFDVLGTPETESSQEIAIRALEGTLDFLAGPPDEGGASGGFGTETMDEWRWGLRHQVRFESLLADFIGDDPSLSFLFDMFAVTTARLPLAEDLPPTDPRAALTWFPRPGDQYDVDAANPGYGGTGFTHRNGPVMRTVIALGPDGVEGYNAIPGGQSGNPDSPHFADRARDWLANETTPLYFTPAQVASGAVSRELFTSE